MTHVAVFVHATGEEILHQPLFKRLKTMPTLGFRRLDQVIEGRQNLGDLFLCLWRRNSRLWTRSKSL